MSHVGKKPIKLPPETSVSVELPYLIAKGQLASSKIFLPEEINVDLLSKNELTVSYTEAKGKSKRETKLRKSLWGTYRTLINNLIIGVSRGFNIKLELVGVGYRASIKNKQLELRLGYSHVINYDIPENIKIECLTPTLISIFGVDRQKVHQVAAEIRRYKKPEPYKGKGIRYEGEQIRLKEGKKK